MQIAVLNEVFNEERRTALTPVGVNRLVKEGWQVLLESNTGSGCSIPDKIYVEQGGKIVPDATCALKNADVVFCLGNEKLIKLDPSVCKKGLIAIGNFDSRNTENVQWQEWVKKSGITLMSLDLLPRITRAQSMDILSSQSNLSGYVSVLEACITYPNAIPMMITSAGTIAPAKVLIMGAGVAGLQAIATARRIGANVLATDVRPDTKEQVESLGAKFLAVIDDEFRAVQKSVYAKQMSQQYQDKQAKLIIDTLPTQNIVITTALIPGRKAPILLSKQAVAVMKPGSVIIDCAASAGGNCALTKPGKVIIHNGVIIVGYTNWPARIPSSSSNMLTGNYINFLKLLTDKSEGLALKLSIPFDDEIIKSIYIGKNTDTVSAKPIDNKNTVKNIINSSNIKPKISNAISKTISKEINQSSKK